MPFPDLESITTAALVITPDIADFPTTLSQYLSKQNIARHYVLIQNEEQKNIPIELVRSLKNSTAYALGNSEFQEIVILWADLLSLPAQQAFLKLLEEPPAHTRFWLVTDKPQTLIETIHSRCTTVSIPGDATQKSTGPSISKSLRDVSIESIKNSTYSQLVTLAAVAKDRAEALDWCDYLLEICRSTNAEDSRSSQAILLATMEQLQQNANTKLSLEECLFQIKTSN
ncbi:hypothetical protein KA012_00455 [Candidatus Woesebacteria bacterium]|nr:hypothetical protein [Candidatus Woesebacteria bacterium]